VLVLVTVLVLVLGMASGLGRVGTVRGF
jgi:hypothetical protein